LNAVQTAAIRAEVPAAFTTMVEQLRFGQLDAGKM